MNKAVVDGYIAKAAELLEASKVAENGKINKTFRGYISSFGAAVTMGSLRSAIAFNSVKGGASDDRQELMKIIYALITGSIYSDNANLLKYVIDENDDAKLKEKICDAAIAIKLAMNLYELV